MPVTDITGIGGDVAFSGDVNAVLETWSATLTVNTVSYAGFGEAFENTKPTTASMTGSAAGRIQFDASSTEPFPLTGSQADLTAYVNTITLTATTGCTYAGSAVLTNINVTRPHNGRADISFDFKFDGEPTSTWDEAG